MFEQHIHDIAPILTALASCLGAIGAIVAAVLSYLNRRLQHGIAADQEMIHTNLQRLEISINGNVNKLVEFARKAGVHEGAKLERESAVAHHKPHRIG